MDLEATARLTDVGVNCIELMPYKYTGMKAKQRLPQWRLFPLELSHPENFLEKENSF